MLYHRPGPEQTSRLLSGTGSSRHRSPHRPPGVPGVCMQRTPLPAGCADLEKRSGENYLEKTPKKKVKVTKPFVFFLYYILLYTSLSYADLNFHH